MSKNAWQNILTTVLVVCALLVTGTVVHREFFQEDGGKQVGHIEGWKELAKGRQPYLGQSTASVQIFVFSDYQCPFCKDLDEKLGLLHSQSDLGFSVWRYETPLANIHPYAFKAAVAAKCAGTQGVLKRFQDELFEHADSLGSIDMIEAARKAGVKDSRAFAECVGNTPSVEAVQKDMKVAEKLGITSTPVFLINGDMYTGTQSIDRLRNLIQDAH